MNNIKIITEVGGVTYSYNQLQFAHDKLRESELVKDQISYLMNAWRSFESNTNFISTYYLIGYKLGQGIIDFDNRINMHVACLRVSKLLAWNGKKSQEIQTLYQSIERLDTFLNKTIPSYGSVDSIDNIKREQCGANEMLVLSNLDIIVANKKLIHVHYLELEVGQRYVITGPSGSGKSSLITKIVGTTANNIGGKGSICYPKNVKISLINQQDYFPLNKNMQEIIFYPGDVKEEKITLIQQLLLRVDLVQYQLNQTEDWYSVLSGGQKQKIRIISALVQEPNVLILDEMFNGLDKKSIELMQTIIIEQLPGTLVISIDHSALENNSTGFYTNFLTVAEGELIDFHKNPNSKYQDEYLCYESFERALNYDQKCYDYEW
jgi:putative ATP-binding cassette transporter